MYNHINPGKIGTGLICKRIYGRGLPVSTEPVPQKRAYLSDKFYVDLKKLDNNILSVKYAKNNAGLPTFKVQDISNDVKDLVEDVITGKYDDRLFKKMCDRDRRIFQRFVRAVKIDLDIKDDDDKLRQQRYEILCGELQAGNTSPENKNELKRYIVEALADGRISRSNAYFILYQLSL